MTYNGQSLYLIYLGVSVLLAVTVLAPIALLTVLIAQRLIQRHQKFRDI